MTQQIESASATGSLARSAQEEADLLYRATGPIDDPNAVIDDFMAASAGYRASHSGVLDVPYGPGSDQVLDIFLPPRATDRAPVHIFIHGGYWYQFGKHEWSFVAKALADAGAIVIVPQYSLCPGVVIAEIVQQMRTMLAWVWRNVSQYGGDNARIFVSGHSAGGHLAMELALTDWQTQYALPSNAIKGVAAISGLYDLLPIRETYVQDQIGLSQRDAERLSPLRRITDGSMPLIIAVAEKDPYGFHYQAQLLGEQWRARGGDPLHLTFPDHNHLTILFEMSDATGRLAKAIQDQMGLYPPS